MEDLKDYGKRSDRIHGELIGIMETPPKDDPEKLMRCQVRVFSLHEGVPTRDLPWAEFKLPVGCRVNDGSFLPPVKGDHVWCDFPHLGDPRRPRVTGSAHFCPNRVPNLPHEAFAGADAYQHKRTGEEPEQPAHLYGEDTVFTQNGVMVAINKDGSFNVVQKGTGTEITVSKDGHIILHGEKDIFFSSTMDTHVNIGGDLKVTIMGEVETTVIGKSATTVLAEMTLASLTKIKETAPVISQNGV